ncbi:MAG TPA: gluconokinase [Chitinophagaceae bacterium]|nr:gluconokinase [Chitinophagaceae bacterium]
MTYYLGVDIGTTSVKAVAFSHTGEVLKTRSVSYKMLHPEPDFCEQQPEEIFGAVITSINDVLQHLDPTRVALVSFSAAMHSLIAVDHNDGCLTNCIIWADNRASEIATQLKDTTTGMAFYHATGVPVHAMSPFAKLIWFKENEPDVFYKAKKFISIKEYVFFRLFGVYVVDTGIASTTGLLNLSSLQWDENVLNYVGVSADKLSLVKDTTTVFYLRNNGDLGDQSLLLSSNTPVVIGSSDGALANVGTGAVTVNSIALTIGTSSAIRIFADQPDTDDLMRTFCYHAKDSCYIVGGASNNGAVVMEWLRHSLLQTNESFESIFHLAEEVPAGSEGLIFLPFILGERAPIWNSLAKGNFFGFSINHTKAHLVRATLEGIVYCLYSIGRVLEEKYEVHQIHATGGFAQSGLWLQIVADVFNRTVVVSDAKESSALGAVILAAESLNLPIEIKTKCSEKYLPDYKTHQQYKLQFQKFERLYDLLKTEFVGNEKEVISSV